jgi:16S rRNA (uracil1498-N3)-methyltransferase
VHLFYQPNFENLSALTDDEAQHAVKVLRMREGDLLRVTNGVGSWFDCTIQKADAKRCTVQVVSQQQTAPRPYHIELAIAPTKNIDRIEWLIEKATEIGIDKFSFFYSKHSERRILKLERLHKIAISAMKQSLQAYLPQIEEVGDFKKYINQATDQQKFIAHLPEDSRPLHLVQVAQPNQRYTVLIGPEGDFTTEEIEMAVANNFKMVTLGQTRLRTETAALVACQILNLVSIV